ncbi:heat stress transcription factor A-5 [Cocos nucifera]|uniref:Heat stress transcription factor A-5 n=1 Tax=Cocos nucifera TaxID=13894 RepID=A0A8K0I066_COCNU|nr:heat stress transcription factor A-5 [Cocos nucifera]KAG1331538.1 heat stress transcription factor A-5 [Cocos nucifera]
MEGGQPGATGGGSGGGGGGPAPFLLKTYDMVDDSSTDDIVSWSPAKNSFIVWNPPDFAARLLPTYFKHNNFSSFIRQLNTYGFRKIDPERWEFANEDFAKGQKHLLKNIHRRKPIHSHSHPPGSLAYSERLVLEEEIEKLTREKAALQADLWRFRQQQPGTKIQLDDLERRLAEMEQRQHKMIAFLQRALQNPRFVENLRKMAVSSSVDFSAIHKKRRLPGMESCQEAPENSFYDDHSSNSKSDVGHGFHMDFCDKLKLELCPAISDNLVASSTQSSNEDNGSPHIKQPECGVVRMENLPLSPLPLDLSDTGASMCPTKNLLLPRAIDEGDGHFSCHLNLTLASSSMQIDSNQHSSRTSNSADHGVANASELGASNIHEDDNLGKAVGNIQSTSLDAKANSLQEVTPSSNQEPAAHEGRANDVFWEQFLTERPGSSDTEEASSSFRANPGDEQLEEGKQVNENIWRNRKDMEQLTL